MATEYEYQVKEKLAADSGLSALVAGRFQATGNKKAVVFIHDKNREDNSLEKVFVAQLPDKSASHRSIINSSLVYANKGEVIEETTGSQRLVLTDGTRYQKDIENDEFRQVAFGKYYIQIQDQKVEHKRRKLEAVPTSELLSEPLPENQAAIHWRIAFPLTCLILTLVAVPLSMVNPRQGRFAKLLPALLLFLSYYLLLISVRNALESSVIPSAVGMWPVHFFALFIGISLLMKSRTAGRKIVAKLPKNSRRGANV